MKVATKAVSVAITSDLLCPWCWVGLRKLQQASKASNVAIDVEWKPYMLRPNTPVEGTPKDGTPATRVPSHLKQVGREMGIDFTGLTDRVPNTSLFHAILKHLQDDLKMNSELVTAYHEAVFEAYFTQGVFPDEAALLQVANTMDDKSVYDAIKKLYTDHDKVATLQETVYDEALRASMAGTSGVPTFAFNGEVAFSGAQPVETFSYFLERASQQ